MMETADAEHADELQGVKMASSFKGPPQDPPGTGTGVMNKHENGSGIQAPFQEEDAAASGPSSSIAGLSEDFEHVLSGQLMGDHTNTSSMEHHLEADRPEISLQIRDVERALQSLSEGPVFSEITTHLSQLVPKIIRLERTVKMQSTLRGIFEEENQRLKNDVKLMKDDSDNVKEENRKLQEEVVELKKAKEDEQLGGFDFVTKKEANEIRDAEKKDAEKQHTEAATGAVSDEAHFNLQRKYLSLKKQIEEIVKVNHSWDEHYRNMKGQLETRIEDLQKQLDDAKNRKLITNLQQAEDDKARDDILVQAKARVEKAEKERAGALAEVVAVNQKCEKLERYARTLTGQRNEMEKEIKRLNEALAHKMKSSFAQPAVTASPGIHATQRDTLRGSLPSDNLQGHNQPSVVGTQKEVGDMSEAEMREEIELLRQQTEVFQSDFTHERQDRQRVMGELDAVQKELRRTKKLLKHEQAMYEDAQFAQQLQQDQQRDRQYSTSAPPRNYGYYVYQQPPARYAYPQQTGRLIAHGRGKRVYNLAGNDMYIDGDDIETDGGPRVSMGSSEALDGVIMPPPNQQNNRICPRCERSFDNDPDYHVHINACLDD